METSVDEDITELPAITMEDEKQADIEMDEQNSKEPMDEDVLDDSPRPDEIDMLEVGQQSAAENQFLSQSLISTTVSMSIPEIEVPPATVVDTPEVVVEEVIQPLDEKQSKIPDSSPQLEEEETSISTEPSFESQTLVELSRHSWGTKDQNYLRGCVWSPDGTCILAPVNQDGMHVLELPTELYTVDNVAASRPLDILQSVVHVPECGTIYDFCWYPFMNSTIPDSCCWISTHQHGPIQMWDAFDGKLRCTYRGYNAVDEVESALSVVFSIDGSSIIGGYRKTIKLFRTDLPGRDCTEFPLKTPASCLAVHHAQENTIAIGSWNCSICLHDVRSPKLDIFDRFDKTHTAGVTMLKFTPDGQQLFSGARKDGQLLCWDLRNTSIPVLKLHRNVETNQRIQFDFSYHGRWLASGDTSGLVRVWDLERSNAANELTEYQFALHNDCCNGVSLHPSRPILATGSGQYHFVESDCDTAVRKPRENSLIFWWYGKSEVENKLI